MIEVQGLTKRYGPTLALDRVSFSVAKGEVLGLLGPNGAGKTTTMRILTCFMPPDEGSATLAGHDIASDSVAVRRAIGYLPESSPLYDDMLVYEYLEYIAAMRGIPSAERRPRVRKMLETCGLEGVVDKMVSQLSKGYRQRVGLAQTLIHDPQILILDEPTTGLDPNQIVEIRDLIRSIGKERTVILSTHILSEVEATCGRVIIIADGRIVASGTPDELSAQSRGGTFYLASVRAPEPLLLMRLKEVAGVTGATLQGSSGDLHRVRIDCGERADIGEAIFRKVAESGWALAELRRETASLESVFRQLTAKEARA